MHSCFASRGTYTVSSCTRCMAPYIAVFFDSASGKCADTQTGSETVGFLPNSQTFSSAFYDSLKEFACFLFCGGLWSGSFSVCLSLVCLPVVVLFVFCVGWLGAFVPFLPVCKRTLSLLRNFVVVMWKFHSHSHASGF